ncbi:hypothetical protein [Sphingomonas sp. Mn802worker]|uniref:hypothetical protein n=1 Tax=Sphingomonas sp. Mn802worker TaxID=629773 RepID=UPI000364DCB9|nr:hypothetical protein [Sphingomonas sp. Mn802worker]
MPVWTILYSVAFWPCLFAVGAACLLWGTRSQKCVALVLVVGLTLGQLSLSAIDYRGLERRLAMIDMIMLCLLVACAMWKPRLPLIFVAAFQLVAVMGHLARIIDPRMDRLTYAILTGATAYCLLIALITDLTLLTLRRRSQARHRAFD